MEGALGDRGKALEEAFFAQKNRELLGKLAEKLHKDEAADALAAVTGVQDHAVLEELVDAGIGTDTLAAFSLVPLIAVAWADRSVAAKERDAIMQAAAGEGIKPQSHASQMLDNWLANAPPETLLETWKDYAGAVSKSLKPAAKAKLAEDVLGRARKVATAAGGILGLGSVSMREEALLKDLAEALG